MIMYSHEIDQTLKSQNYNIDTDTYLHICNSSPQVTHVKYDPYSDSFELWTKDDYYWKIKIYRKED